jgi:hypothetical protein
MTITIQGALLHAPVGSRLPKVCLRCGASREVRRRAETFVVGTGQAVPIGGSVLGVTVAMSIRAAFPDRPMLQALAILVISAVVIPLALLWNRSLARVSIAVPLCPPCEEAAERAQQLVVPSLVGLALCVLMALAGMATGVMWLAALAIVLLLALVGVVWLVRPKQARVVPLKVNESEIVFRPAERALGKIARRLEKRAARLSREAALSAAT